MLDDDDDDEDEAADVTEAFPRGSTFIEGGALSLADNWGSSGSGGTWEDDGESDVPRLLPVDLGGGIGAVGGEYWVPASAVTLVELVEKLSEGERGRLLDDAEIDFGDCGMFRGNAAGGGGLMKEVRGEREKAVDPL